jgi:hypothetical protein
MRSGLRHCQSFAVIDAHAAGEIQPVAIRRIGADLIFGRLWKESGIPEVLRSVLKARQYGFDMERAIYLTVLHRLFASGSDRAAERSSFEIRDDLMNDLEINLFEGYKRLINLTHAVEFNEHLLLLRPGRRIWKKSHR